MSPTPPGFDFSDAEWQILITEHPNLLLVGERSATEQILRALEPHLACPRYSWRAPAELRLPHDRRGSLILFEVSALLSEQQSYLADWLKQDQQPIQVISTTAQPLFSLVEQGQFRADLYYRLNTMRVECAFADQAGRETRPIESPSSH